jgi:U3 small nucleolar RNA-associated protein 15
MLEELASRAGLHAALAGRSPQQLLPLLQHLSRHVTDPRHSRVLAGVTARVLDLYAASAQSDPEVRVCGRRLIVDRCGQATCQCACGDRVAISQCYTFIHSES